MEMKVSVIVCSFNARNDLAECLESLETQDYDAIEIIVVNDASTDDTATFLLQFQERSRREILVVTNSTNLGVAGSRNVGIQRATGDIIAFTDADCVADRRWVSELISIYRDRDVAAVGGSILSREITNIWELVAKGQDFVASQEGYVSYIQGCNMSFDRRVLERFSFNTDLKYGYEEALLCDDLIRGGYKIYYRPQAKVLHRYRSDFVALMRRKYLLGVSSIWYRKKRKKLVMFKRHLVLLIALLLAPFMGMNKIFFYLPVFFFIIFAASLLRDEILFNMKNLKEVALTFPVLMVIELPHFVGSLAGILRFWILPKSAAR
jgi:glycosyltransferase involved in cell wall biosynthesis